MGPLHCAKPDRARLTFSIGLSLWHGSQSAQRNKTIKRSRLTKKSPECKHQGWRCLQCVVPKQNHTAMLQQKRHFHTAHRAQRHPEQVRLDEDER